LALFILFALFQWTSAARATERRDPRPDGVRFLHSAAGTFLRVTTRLHDHEPDTSPGTVRTLLRRQVPELADLPLQPLSNTGSDNALYRLGAELVVRLPRFGDAARRLGVELDWLPRLRGLPAAIPEVVHAGSPHELYPFDWAVLGWLDGVDAWEARQQDGWFGSDLGHDLAAVVQHLRRTAVADAPLREPGERGGPLRSLDDRVHGWLSQSGGLVDVRAVLRLWEQCLEGEDDGVDPVLLHGDLIPGNLLVGSGRLTAVLDWGGLGAGDPAQDLDPAWAVLDEAGAAAIREDLDVDEASWLRARGFALEQAIGGVIYYTARRHPLALVMQRTLDRLLSER
jgi:aminoglycoside phosphotransferase (APT) family kinase protein